MAQINLLNVPVLSDVVYTPDDVARDIVAYFKPAGRVLEPAAGDGAFLSHMPGAEWCELEKGRDFFAWGEAVDWIVGNPPYSIFSEFMRHSMTVAKNIVFLIPINKAFNSSKMIKDIYQWGGDRPLPGVWRRGVIWIALRICNGCNALSAWLHRRDVNVVLGKKEG